MAKNEQYELDGLLHEINEEGFVCIRISKLFRLLGKGNKAAGTWRALLDAWEGISEPRKTLHGSEVGPDTILLTNYPLERITKWAGE